MLSKQFQNVNVVERGKGVDIHPVRVKVVLDNAPLLVLHI
jgi:hypothetical protein